MKKTPTSPKLFPHFGARFLLAPFTWGVFGDHSGRRGNGRKGSSWTLVCVFLVIFCFIIGGYGLLKGFDGCDHGD